MAFDLLVRGGRLIDPASGADAVRDVAFAAGRVTAIEPQIAPELARQVVDATGAIVTPGLIDLHTHVYWGGTALGVDAERLAARSGATTFVDAGSAGAGNFLGFRRHVIERSKVRILAFLNISFAGIFGFSNRVMVGEGAEPKLCEPAEIVACARDNADLIAGVKVRAGRFASGDSGTATLDLALKAAETLQLPLMAHIDEPPPGRGEVLERLRPGDILTHCFRPPPNAPLTEAGAVRDDMRAARARRVLFDIGHGMGSFDFEVARAMLEGGFAPDIISSDVHMLCVDGPAFDLLTCMSKLLALGMPLQAVLRAASLQPAQAIGRDDLGRLAVGLPGDLSVLELVQGAHQFTDSVGRDVTGDQRLVARGVVCGGNWRPNHEGVATPRRIGPDETQADLVRRHFSCGCGDG